MKKIILPILLLLSACSPLQKLDRSNIGKNIDKNSICYSISGAHYFYKQLSLVPKYTKIIVETSDGKVFQGIFRGFNKKNFKICISNSKNSWVHTIPAFHIKQIWIVVKEENAKSLADLASVEF